MTTGHSLRGLAMLDAYANRGRRGRCTAARVAKRTAKNATRTTNANQAAN